MTADTEKLEDATELIESRLSAIERIVTALAIRQGVGHPYEITPYVDAWLRVIEEGPIYPSELAEKSRSLSRAINGLPK